MPRKPNKMPLKPRKMLLKKKRKLMKKPRIRKEVLMLTRSPLKPIRRKQRN